LIEESKRSETGKDFRAIIQRITKAWRSRDNFTGVNIQELAKDSKWLPHGKNP
jgi:hypothetical protein